MHSAQLKINVKQQPLHTRSQEHSLIILIFVFCGPVVEIGLLIVVLDQNMM